MKRGIPIALQAAGAVLACLVTTLNHPVIANVQTVYQDTVHYYNKHGKVIFRNTKAATTGNYIIRTCKTHRQIFDDWYDRDTTKISRDYKPAEVFGIEGWEARKTRRRIHRGNVNDTLVLKCIVPVLDKMSIKKMLDSIKAGRTKDEKDKDFREYGGVINTDTSLICKRGDSTDPRKPENEGLKMDLGKNGNFHSHPEGFIEIKDDSTDAFNPNRVIFVVHNRSHKYCFIQGPSNNDQEVIGDKVGYVFGMRSELIYLYDKKGVRAILPFSSLLPKAVNK